MGKTGSKVNIASNMIPMIAKLELRFKPEKIFQHTYPCIIPNSVINTIIPGCNIDKFNIQFFILNLFRDNIT